MARTYISFVSLVDIVGIEDATALCRAHGGRGVYVAKRPEKSSLTAIISGAACESLCAAYGGEEISIGRGPLAPIPVKVVVARLLEEGKSLSETAREAGCSQRYCDMIRRDLNLPKPAPSPKPEVVIPSAPRLPKKYVVLAMLSNNEEGLTIREIAERCGVSENYAYDLRAQFGLSPHRKRQKADTGDAVNA